MSTSSRIRQRDLLVCFLQLFIFIIYSLSDKTSVEKEKKINFIFSFYIISFIKKYRQKKMFLV